MIKDIIFENPIPLLEINNPDIIKAIDNYLPFSSAFETECNTEPNFNIKVFKDIPDIMDASGDDGEVRFRVPSGLKGLVCLYNISIKLKEHCTLNLRSGNHYHVDCTDVWDNIEKRHVQEYYDYILSELETWDYKGTYNYKGIYGKGFSSGYWLRFNVLKTMEFRIGEMTFDYSVLVKRIIHCNEIVRKFKLFVLEGDNQVRIEKLNTELSRLREKLKSYKKEEEDKLLENSSFVEVGKEVIKTRIIKI